MIKYLRSRHKEIKIPANQTERTWRWGKDERKKNDWPSAYVILSLCMVRVKLLYSAVVVVHRCCPTRLQEVQGVWGVQLVAGAGVCPHPYTWGRPTPAVPRVLHRPAQVSPLHQVSSATGVNTTLCCKLVTGEWYELFIIHTATNNIHIRYSLTHSLSLSGMFWWIFTLHEARSPAKKFKKKIFIWLVSSWRLVKTNILSLFFDILEKFDCRR